MGAGASGSWTRGKQRGADAPSWPRRTLAVRPQEGYFKLSNRDDLESDDGRRVFTPSANGKRRNLMFDPARRRRCWRRSWNWRARIKCRGADGGGG